MWYELSGYGPKTLSPAEIWHHLCTSEPRARPSRRLAAWCSASRPPPRTSETARVDKWRSSNPASLLQSRLPHPDSPTGAGLQLKWIRAPRRRRGGCGAYSPPTTAVGSADRARRPHRSPPSTATDSITTLTSRIRCAMSRWPSSRRGASPWPARSSSSTATCRCWCTRTTPSSSWPPTPSSRCEATSPPSSPGSRNSPPAWTPPPPRPKPSTSSSRRTGNRSSSSTASAL